MSHRGLLPDEGAALPPDDSSPPPVDPKYKAVILYFMLFAEKAGRRTKITEQAAVLRECAHLPASELLQIVYKVDIHPDTIWAYYHEVKSNLEAGGNFDMYTFAQIICQQVQNEETFEEVFSFISRGIKEWDSLTPIQKFVLGKVLGATRSTDGPGQPKTLTTLVAFFRGAVAPKDRHLPDPELEQPRDMRLETSNEYEHLRQLEHWLNKNPPSLPLSDD